MLEYTLFGGVREAGILRLCFLDGVNARSQCATRLNAADGFGYSSDFNSIRFLNFFSVHKVSQLQGIVERRTDSTCTCC